MWMLEPENGMKRNPIGVSSTVTPRTFGIACWTIPCTLPGVRPLSWLANWLRLTLPW